MAQIKPPQKVKLIVAMLTAEQKLFTAAEQDMAQLWGNIDLASDIMPFTYTDYYHKQMGPSLWRKLVSINNLIDPGQLPAVKHQSNDLETKWSQLPLGKQLNVDRPINLDPGYIEPSKLVLASTKNYSHRIYIGDSIYAECTLHYHQGTWQSWPFTYPDFGSGDYDDFLNQTRQRLMEQISSKKQST